MPPLLPGCPRVSSHRKEIGCGVDGLVAVLGEMESSNPLGSRELWFLWIVAFSIEWFFFFI